MMPYKRLKIAKGYIDKALHKPLNYLAKKGLKPIHLTILSLPAGIGSVIFLDVNPLLSALLIITYIALDVLDGTLARVSSQVTEKGAKLDFLFDRVVACSFLIKLYLTGQNTMLPLIGLTLIVAVSLEDTGLLKR